MFVKDLKVGKDAEQKLMELLNGVGVKTGPVSVDNRKFWDLECEGFQDGDFGSFNDFTVEVKFDAYEQKSGNIAIELHNPKSDKPSGLGLTKATLWAHCLHDAIFLTATQKLRDYVDKTKPDRIIKRGGDGNAFIYLYKRIDLMPAIFKEVNGDGSNLISILLELL